MRNTENVLRVHRDRGKKGQTLERVYRHRYNPELSLKAYAKISQNQGALTKGVTQETVDGRSLDRIMRIIDLIKHERYRWTPVRRVEIPKPKGGKRPLSIPTWSDKIVQEVMRILLDAYYEPRFFNSSHGFRPKRGCHTALMDIKKRWNSIVWFIEGDISKCFDTIDHDILLGIIRRDIKDERFMRLLKGAIKAGYLQDWTMSQSPSGTPQGGIVARPRVIPQVPYQARPHRVEFDIAHYRQQIVLAVHHRPGSRVGDRRATSKDALFQSPPSEPSV